MSNTTRKIYLVGGCLRGVEEYFRRLKGTVNTKVGYANGIRDGVSYRDVCSGTTGHTETVELVYDPIVLPLEAIIDHLFRIIDPTSLNRQGNDIGTQYRTGIYYTDDNDRTIIEATIAILASSINGPLLVEVRALENFTIEKMSIGFI
ncbi:peptide-methionine (S)-S-oxide reductase MsrA [Erysipelothrix sp. D19-032]